MSTLVAKDWEFVVDHVSRESHVHPRHDLVEHSVHRGAGAECVCDPTPDLIETEHGDYWEFVHHSLDGREASE